MILGNIISSYDIEEEAENVKEEPVKKSRMRKNRKVRRKNGEADGSDTAERHVSLEENPFEAVAKIADEYYASPEYYYEKAIRIDPNTVRVTSVWRSCGRKADDMTRQNKRLKQLSLSIPK